MRCGIRMNPSHLKREFECSRQRLNVDINSLAGAEHISDFDASVRTFAQGSVLLVVDFLDSVKHYSLPHSAVLSFRSYTKNSVFSAASSTCFAVGMPARI